MLSSFHRRLAVLAVVAVLPVSAWAASRSELAAAAKDPAVMSRNMPFHEARPSDAARYVALSDGTRIALFFHFPDGFEPASSKVPSVHLETLYGHREEITTTAIDLWRKAGFAVVVSDVRGFGASFGNAQWDGAADERDQKEILAWIAAQPWSDGRVAAVGLSISATYADVMTATESPALKAAIIRAEDFDHYADNLFPGGIPNLGIAALVTELIAWHAGGPCLEKLSACAELGFQAVDEDRDFSALREAIKDHQASLPAAAFAGVTYSDDKLGPGTLIGYSAASRLPSIAAAAVPARVSASWLDGTTADSALARFAGAPAAPMEVVIGATTHPAGLDADPFAETPFGDARPPALVQFQADVDFVRRVLGGEKIGRSVKYAVLGSDAWKTTPIWPPVGTERVRTELQRGQLAKSETVAAEIAYRVDPESTFGPLDRWASQRGRPIFYGDLATAPGKRLEFTGAPVTTDMELVGAAELCLVMRTDQKDGTLIAYLEDVAPDGRVTYLTEAELRLLHRKVAGAACDPAPGARRSFARADGSPAVPGETMKIELPFLATAALIREGHAIRLALSGADAITFPAPAGDTPAQWSIDVGGHDGSHLTLPLRRWSE